KMAELRTRKSELEEFLKEYFHRNREAEENRQRENQAATTIQSCFRACKVRVYISYLHKKAIIIQARWRGFTARARVRQMVKEAYFIMKMNFYQEMAVRIQRRWRGFFVRKYIHNFYARKQYLEGLAEQNNLRRRELDEFEELQRRERHCVKMVKEQTARVQKAHRLHHLLSTEQSPGIFNSPFRSAPHEMELLLRQVKYRVPAKIASRGGNNLMGCPSRMGAATFPGTGIRSTRNGCSRPILPRLFSQTRLFSRVLASEKSLSKQLHTNRLILVLLLHIHEWACL
uniref:Spermatogenesis associated 17 n=1 Tax=Gouania willdenowi TaxID=441366 RepID=A0A8C5EHJ8_GOUWI